MAREITVKRFGTWRIEDGFGSGVLLKYRLNGQQHFSVSQSYDSEDMAAYAVAKSQTTEASWNALNHRPEDFDLSKWKKVD